MGEMMMPAVYVEFGELAHRLGVRNIKELPGCWEYQIDEQWWMAVNGHKEPVRCSKGAEVPAWHLYFEYNGWPAGFVGPSGGTVAAGEGANEATLLRALRKAPL